MTVVTAFAGAFFAGFVMAVVAAGVRFGVRVARAFREANAQLVADLEFYKAIPSDMEEDK